MGNNLAHLIPPKTKKESRITISPFEFATKNPEPGLINPKDPNSKEFNRVLKSSEINIHFLASYMEFLNIHALQIFYSIGYDYGQRNNFIEIKRFLPTSPYFNLKHYRIRYLGCHGKNAINLFLITHEDESNPIIVRHLKIDSACKICGSWNMFFKIKPSSKNKRCAVCHCIPGTKKVVF